MYDFRVLEIQTEKRMFQIKTILCFSYFLIYLRQIISKTSTNENKIQYKLQL